MAPWASSPNRIRGVSTPMAGIRSRAGGATVGCVRGERNPAAWSVLGRGVEDAAADDARTVVGCVPPAHPASPAAARTSAAATAAGPGMSPPADLSGHAAAARLAAPFGEVGAECEADGVRELAGQAEHLVVRLVAQLMGLVVVLGLVGGQLAHEHPVVLVVRLGERLRAELRLRRPGEERRERRCERLQPGLGRTGAGVVALDGR